MYVLNYWHTVSDYAEWKKIFDSDPLGREASGVRRVSIERPVDDENTVIGELEFDSLAEAETFAGRLQEVWNGLGSQVVSNAGHRLTEVLEQKLFGRESGRRAA
jgi:hypothetical protein